MAHGGRAFLKPFGLQLGTNGEMVDYLYTDTAGLAAAVAMGMKVWREEVPWNFSKGGGGTFSGIEAVAGTFSSANAAIVASTVATIKANGLTPLLILSVNTNPGLTSTWASGPPTTVAQFAAMCAWIVAQPGLQGLHWTLFNEPDGAQWGIPHALLTAAFQAAYPAMKAADPTCIVHCSPMEDFASNAGDQGMFYKNQLYTDGILGYYDVDEIHAYSVDSGYSETVGPYYVGPYGVDIFDGLSAWQTNRIAKGDTTPCWWTEGGWQTSGVGLNTPALVAQWYQDMLTRINGMDVANGVLYSSWLKVFCQYAMNANGSAWGVLGTPAQTILTELVAGH